MAGLLTAAGAANAQTFNDVTYVNYTYAPATNFQHVEGKSTLYNTIEVQLSAPPVRLGRRLGWINTVYGRSINYHFANKPAGVSPLPDRLSDIRYTSLFSYRASPKLDLLLIPTVMLRSDFAQSLSADDVFVSGLLLAAYNPDGAGRLVLSAGALLTNDFSRNQLTPVLGMTYKSPKLTLQLTYPRINILVKPTPKLEFGLTAAVDAAIFRVKPLDGAGNQSAYFVRTVNLSAGPALSYNLGGRVWLNTQAGYVFLRNYDLLDVNAKPISDARTDLLGSFYGKAGISIRFGK